MSSLSAPSFIWQVVASGRDTPGPRSRHCLAYDAAARATVLFGGIIWADNGRLLSDTWELRDGRWSQIQASPCPPPCHRGAMAYDGRRGFAVQFGGQGETGAFLNETWIYEDRQWRQRKGWWHSPPEPRCGHALAFDEALGGTVLFGGIGHGDRPLGDTWLFNGSSWRQVKGSGPPARRYAALAYDPDLGGCILHGGSVDDAGHHMYGDTWLFRDRAWTRLPDGFTTEPRDDHGLAYHRAARQLVMLEGINGARGLLARSPDGWQQVSATPLHSRHQCSPLVWDERLNGLVLHGGETHHRGSQFDTTSVLRLVGG